ncbi:MAG: S46 family peptidase [Planctomycetota bacterium]
MKTSFVLFLLGWCAVSASTIAFADEGMYLFNDLPRERLKDQYQFEPTAQWVKHLQRASVRFNSGGSGSFISKHGLVLTNHHVAADTLAKLSTSNRNLIEDGYLARSAAAELKAPDLELNVLQDISDVTDRVRTSVGAEVDPEKSLALRRAEIARIESESFEASGLRSDVVTLFGGAKFHLYRYKKYTDIRLVWAPETAAAFFGGDADNFEYPRFNLDATIFRVYEEGKPADIADFLRFSDQPVVAGDLVFVSGHPGRTQRMFTVEALEYLRDKRLPYVLDLLRRKEILLQQYRLNGKEAARRGRDDLFGIQNARKAYSGMLAGLQDPQTIATKRERQDRLLEMLPLTEEFADATSAWREVAKIQTSKAELLGQSVSFRSQLFQLALQIVLLAKEDLKPNEQRYPEFTDAARDSLRAKLLSTAPIYDDLERVKLADELSMLLEHRGFDDSLVQKVFMNQSPRQAAQRLVESTQLFDVSFRKRVLEGGLDAIDQTDDPMIELAMIVEDEYRRLRAKEETLAEREKRAYAEIDAATTAMEGTDGYPDATFTLRLAFGTVKGYEEDGTFVEPTTTFAGAYARAAENQGQDDFDLPKSWQRNESAVVRGRQLNFVCTADVIGGNSGSPVVDRSGDLVGLIFDGNIQSLTSDYLYTDRQSRAVSVSGVGILEALEKIYAAGELIGEIKRGVGPAVDDKPLSGTSKSP